MAAIFEAPAGHEGVQEWEWEQQEGSHLEGSSEWEQAATGEWEWEQPGSGEWEWEQPGSGEWEWEAGTAAGEWEDEQAGLGEWESEWEQAGAGEWEWEAGAGEWEADAFSFGSLMKGIGNIAKTALPMATKALGSMIPVVGPLAGPVLGQLAQSLVGQGEAEAAAVEAEAFGGNRGEAEIGGSETAHEAALSELLAAEAATASSEAEAASTIAATLPLTITVMRAGRATRGVMPVLVQANSRLSRALRRSGPQGRQLQRAMPSIQRVAVGTMKSAARRGQPVTAPLAVKSMAAATRRVLGNPRRAEAVLRRNAALRQRTAPGPVPPGTVRRRPAGRAAAGRAGRPAAARSARAAPAGRPPGERLPPGRAPRPGRTPTACSAAGSLPRRSTCTGTPPRSGRSATPSSAPVMPRPAAPTSMRSTGSSVSSGTGWATRPPTPTPRPRPRSSAPPTRTWPCCFGARRRSPARSFTPRGAALWQPRR